jgi:hypothetical protein
MDNKLSNKIIRDIKQKILFQSAELTVFAAGTCVFPFLHPSSLIMIISKNV